MAMSSDAIPVQFRALRRTVLSEDVDFRSKALVLLQPGACVTYLGETRSCPTLKVDRMFCRMDCPERKVHLAGWITPVGNKGATYLQPAEEEEEVPAKSDGAASIGMDDVEEEEAVEAVEGGETEEEQFDFAEVRSRDCADEKERAMWSQASRFLKWHRETMGKFPWSIAMAKATGLKADDVQHCRTFADLEACFSNMNMKSRLRPMAINLGIEKRGGAHLKKKDLLTAIVTTFRRNCIDTEIDALDADWQGDRGSLNGDGHDDLAREDEDENDSEVALSLAQALCLRMSQATPIIRKELIAQIVSEQTMWLVEKGRLPPQVSAFRTSEEAWARIVAAVEMFIALVIQDGITFSKAMLKSRGERKVIKLTALFAQLSESKQCAAHRTPLADLLEWFEQRQAPVDAYAGQVAAQDLGAAAKIPTKALKKILVIVESEEKTRVEAKVWNGLRHGVVEFVRSVAEVAFKRALKDGKRKLAKQYILKLGAGKMPAAVCDGTP